jgi:L-ectoine synthase
VIVRQLETVLGTEREVDTPNWTSRRLLLRRDGMGFSLHDTVIRPGTETHMCYANHLEAVYCIEGEGEIEVADTGEVFAIAPGTVYALDGHERHALRAHTRMRMVCVFNPPVAGDEVHDADGVYPLIEELIEEPVHSAVAR